jgi:hypothetical protein
LKSKAIIDNPECSFPYFPEVDSAGFKEYAVKYGVNDKNGIW